MDGYVYGRGLTGPGYAATLEKCKNDCDARNDCHFFAHSISKQKCRLIEQRIPTDKKFQDYQVCSKRKFYMAFLSSYYV